MTEPTAPTDAAVDTAPVGPLGVDISATSPTSIPVPSAAVAASSPAPITLESPDQLDADVAALKTQVADLATHEEVDDLAARLGKLEAAAAASASSAGGKVLELVTATFTDPVYSNDVVMIGIVVEDHEENNGVLIAPLTPVGIRIPREDVTVFDPTVVPAS